MRFVIATLAFSIAAPAFAAPAEVHQFDRDGSRYQYVQTRKADGSVLLKGEVLDTLDAHDAFELRVAKTGRVSGTVGASAVSFIVSKETMAALDAGTPAAAAALAAN